MPNHARIVMAEVARAFGVETVSLGDELGDIGATSAAILRLTAALERTLGMRIDIIEVFAAETVADLVELAGSPSNGRSAAS